MTSVSVIGATGLLGSRILRRLRTGSAGGLQATGTGLRRPGGPGVDRLDVTDPAALAAHLEADFDLVVVAAGTKDVRRCEQDPDHALALNTRPIEEMVRIVRRAGLRTRIVGLSTDYVFDGERGGYREGDAAAPRTQYGRSKLLAEQALLQAGAGHKVVRSGAAVGRGALFFDWVVSELEAGREVPLFDDCRFSPTPLGLLADLVLALLEAIGEAPEPVLHFVGEQAMSRYQLGSLIARHLPTARSHPVPERRARGGPLFQADLSLVQSAFARRHQRRSLEQYLAEELRPA